MVEIILRMQVFTYNVYIEITYAVEIIKLNNLFII